MQKVDQQAAVTDCLGGVAGRALGQRLLIPHQGRRDRAAANDNDGTAKVARGNKGGTKPTRKGAGE